MTSYVLVYEISSDTGKSKYTIMDSDDSVVRTKYSSSSEQQQQRNTGRTPKNAIHTTNNLVYRAAPMDDIGQLFPIR